MQQLRAELDALGRTHYERFLAVARRILGCEEAARDAVQDAFLSAVRKLSTFQGRAQLSTWMHAIVVNAARMRGRRFAHDSLRKARSIKDSDAVYMPASARDALPSCLESLSPETRRLIELRYECGYDVREVARRFGISPNAAKVRLLRARNRMRESYLEIVRRNRATAALLRTGKSSAGVSTIAGALRTGLEEWITFDCFGVAVVDRHQLRLVSMSDGVSPRRQYFEHSRTFSDHVCTTREVCRVERLDDLAAWPSSLSFHASIGARSSCVAPLIAGGAVFGVAFWTSCKERAFGAEQERHVRTFAPTLAKIVHSHLRASA